MSPRTALSNKKSYHQRIGREVVHDAVEDTSACGRPIVVCATWHPHVRTGAGDNGTMPRILLDQIFM